VACGGTQSKNRERANGGSGAVSNTASPVDRLFCPVAISARREQPIFADGVTEELTTDSVRIGDRAGANAYGRTEKKKKFNKPPNTPTPPPPHPKKKTPHHPPPPKNPPNPPPKKPPPPPPPNPPTPPNPPPHPPKKGLKPRQREADWPRVGSAALCGRRKYKEASLLEEIHIR